MGVMMTLYLVLKAGLSESCIASLKAFPAFSVLTLNSCCVSSFKQERHKFLSNGRVDDLVNGEEDQKVARYRSLFSSNSFVLVLWENVIHSTRRVGGVLWLVVYALHLLHWNSMRGAKRISVFLSL